MKHLPLVQAAIAASTLTILSYAVGFQLYRGAFLYSWSHNDGFNALVTDAYVKTGQLYYPADALITNNYPPLSFIVTGWLMAAIPDAVLAGRAIADASFLGIGLSIMAIIWLQVRDKLARISHRLGVFIHVCIVL